MQLKFCNVNLTSQRKREHQLCRTCFLELKCHPAVPAERGKANELVSDCGSLCLASLKSSTVEEIFLSFLGESYLTVHVSNF